MQQIKRVLKRFGLSSKETSVYLQCLKKDNLSPYTISKATNIPRTTVYDILMNLSLKGLVELEQSDGFTKQQTRVHAKNPSHLRKILQQKRKDLMHLETDIVDILPFLKQDFHKQEPNADFRFYPGIKGFKQVYLNFDFKGIDEQLYIWDCLMPMDVLGFEEMNTLIDRDANRFHKKAKYKSKEIVALTDWTRHVLSYQYGRNHDYIKLRDLKYIESPGFDLSVEMNIIADQIRIACAQENEVWGLVINSKALSDSFKAIFMVQWLSAKPVTKKLVESWGKNEMWEWEKKLRIRNSELKSKKPK